MNASTAARMTAAAKQSDSMPVEVNVKEMNAKLKSAMERKGMTGYSMWRKKK